MPWWIIVALSLLGLASQKRHALPMLSPEEQEILRAFDFFRRRRTTLAVVEEKIRAAQVLVLARRQDLDRRIAAHRARIAQLEAAGVEVAPPELTLELQKIHEGLEDFKQQTERYERYAEEYVKLVREEQSRIINANPPSHP